MDDYKQTKISDESDIPSANAKFDSAEKKGLVATILIPAGAVVLALGATLLVLDLSADESPAQVSLTPLPGGGMLSFRASGGGL